MEVVILWKVCQSLPECEPATQNTFETWRNIFFEAFEAQLQRFWVWGQEEGEQKCWWLPQPERFARPGEMEFWGLGLVMMAEKLDKVERTWGTGLMLVSCCWCWKDIEVFNRLEIHWQWALEVGSVAAEPVIRQGSRPKDTKSSRHCLQQVHT